MSKITAAAKFFAENPEEDHVLVTEDESVFFPSQMNLVVFHATQNNLSPAYAEYFRTDSGMDALIATAEQVIVERAAYLDTRKAVEKVAAEAAAPTTYEAGLTALATSLGMAALTNLEEYYQVDDLTYLTLEEAVVATWYRSGLTVSAWAAQNQATREAAVAAAFPTIIELD